MADPKFTPGPWEVLVGDNYTVISRNYPNTYPHQFEADDTGPDLAAAGNRSVDFGEANAHLIAAAPELYEALDGLVVFCSDTLSGRADGATDVAWLIDGYREIRNRCRAALAKARGETP